VYQLVNETFTPIETNLSKPARCQSSKTNT